MTDSDKNIELAGAIVLHEVNGKPTPIAVAAGIGACAHALIAIAKELRAIRQTMEKMKANRGTIWAKI